MPVSLSDVTTPAAVVDTQRLARNLDRMAEYAKRHGLALRPHTKTHKTPQLAAEQLRRGAAGLTVATPLEAEVMSSVCDDLLVAYPPVGGGRLQRLLALPSHVRVTVALDSAEALDLLARAAHIAGREIGVYVEIDLGMRRVGVQTPPEAVALARRAAAASGVRYDGVLFYPGHVRGPVAQQQPELDALSRQLAEFLQALADANLSPGTVSGGSTPTAFATHRIAGITEMRPGTYVFNDRTTAAVGACDWDDCAYTILATVVSTAVPGQAVVDAGAKALAKEEIRAAGVEGYGQLLDRPDVVVRAVSEEHGILDLSTTDWRPRVGDRVRIIPNHVCVSVNLQNQLWYVDGDEVRHVLPVRGRGWLEARPGEAAVSVSLLVGSASRA
jgi:D-serine deaminase-like pyridoxal phosphate-dependent protein